MAKVIISHYARFLIAKCPMLLALTAPGFVSFLTRKAPMLYSSGRSGTTELITRERVSLIPCYLAMEKALFNKVFPMKLADQVA